MAANQYYEERLQFHPEDREVSQRTYNAVIGGVLLYGFVINAIIVMLFKNKAIEMYLNPTMGYAKGLIAFAVTFIICGIIGALLVHRSDNPVVSFIGFNFFAIPFGFMLAFAVIPVYEPAIVARAFALTAIITLAMLVVSSIVPDAFLSMGKVLFISLIVCVAVDIIGFFIVGNLLIIDYAMTFIFTLYIGYDWARANACVKTIDNAVDCAAELYLDIINLFIRILQILARSDN